MAPGIPSKAVLNFYLHEGAVFYIQDRNLTSAEPHYFVVLNLSPAKEDILLLVVSTSQIEAAKRRYEQMPPDTLVEISPNEYTAFTKPSLISCNQVFTKTKQQLLEQINHGGEQKQRMPKDILEKLRQGVLASPTVERHIKQKIASHQSSPSIVD